MQLLDQDFKQILSSAHCRHIVVAAVVVQQFYLIETKINKKSIDTLVSATSMAMAHICRSTGARGPPLLTAICILAHHPLFLPFLETNQNLIFHNVLYYLVTKGPTYYLSPLYNFSFPTHITSSTDLLLSAHYSIISFLFPLFFYLFPKLKCT